MATQRVFLLPQTAPFSLTFPYFEERKIARRWRFAKNVSRKEFRYRRKGKPK
jgi:hypothetical protein